MASKKSSKTKTVPKMKLKSKSKRIPLSEIREQLQPLLDLARKKISQLMKSGDYEYSQAVQDALKSRSRAKGVNQEDLFSIDEKHRARELYREGNRLLAFISNPTSNVTGGNFTKLLSFHNQAENMKEYGKRFNVSEEDEDRLKLAFRIFRDISTTETSVIGPEGYGSDNLINLIYDSLEGYNPDFSDESTNNSLAITAAYEKAYSSVNEWKQNMNQGFFTGSPNVNKDLDIVTILKDSMSVDDFLNKFSRRNL